MEGKDFTYHSSQNRDLYFHSSLELPIVSISYRDREAADLKKKFQNSTLITLKTIVELNNILTCKAQNNFQSKHPANRITFTCLNNGYKCPNAQSWMKEGDRLIHQNCSDAG